MKQLSVQLPSRPRDTVVRDAVARALGILPSDVALDDEVGGEASVGFFESGAPFPVHLIVGRDRDVEPLTDADLGLEIARLAGIDALCSTHRFADPRQHDGVVVHSDGSATFFWDDDETNLRLDGPAASTAAE